AVHQTLEVIGNGLVGDSAFGTLDDQVRRFYPAHVTQHHFCGQDQGAGVDLVLASVLGCSTVGCFEHRNRIGQVGARSDTDTAHFRGQRVGQVVTVQVQGRDHVILGRTQQDLLQHGVSDGVLHDNVLAGVRVLELHPRAAVQQLGTELVTGHFVAPFLEGTFGELHDVALVNDSHGAAIIVHGVLQGLANQTLGTFLGNRLDADTAVFGEADLGDAHFLGEELDDFLGFRGAGLPLDTGIDVFGVLTEDDHVHVAGVLDRAGYTGEPANGALANVQVQLLAQGNVQRANAAAYWRGQRALDGNHVVLDRVQGLFGQPGVLVIDLGGLLAGENFHPGDLALATVGFFHGGIDYFHHDR